MNDNKLLHYLEAFTQKNINDATVNDWCEAEYSYYLKYGVYGTPILVQTFFDTNIRLRIHKILKEFQINPNDYNISHNNMTSYFKIEILNNQQLFEDNIENISRIMDMPLKIEHRTVNYKYYA